MVFLSDWAAWQEIAWHDLDLGVKVMERSQQQQKYPQHWSLIVLNTKFVLQIVFFRQQKQYSAAAETD